MTSDGIAIPTRPTPEQLTAHLRAMGLAASLIDHAGSPGSQPQPTVALPAGGMVIIGNILDGTEQRGVPMGPVLHAGRYGTNCSSDECSAHDDFIEAKDGSTADVVSQVLRWACAADAVHNYSVAVQVSFSVTVPVTAANPEAAAQLVSLRNFDLPAIDEWTRGKDWNYAVFGADGPELYELSS
jgi:hypothetical protein